MGIAWAFYSLGAVALARRHHEQALRLVGACDALLEEAGEMPALAVATLGDVGQGARAALDEARADVIYREGLELPPENALAYALGVAPAGDGRGGT